MRSEKGQAAIEYILLLFLVVLIATGALLKFSRSFTVFAKNFLGEYTECLLETGELPTLGSSAPAECQHLAFRLDASTTSDSASGGGSGTNPSSTNNSNALGDANKGSSDSSGSGSGSGSGSDGRAGAAGFSSGGGRRFSSSSNESEGKSKQSPEDSGGDSARRVNVVDETVDLRKGKGGDRYIPIKDASGGTDKEKTTVSVVKGEATEPKGSKKILVQPEIRKPTSEPPDEPLTFGRFLKILIIVAIVIAILVFFGSQIQGYMKSRENS